MLDMNRQNPVDEIQSLLTIDDLVRIFRINRRTISKLVDQGRLPIPIRIGESLRWTKEDIQKVIRGSMEPKS